MSIDRHFDQIRFPFETELRGTYYDLGPINQPRQTKDGDQIFLTRSIIPSKETAHLHAIGIENGEKVTFIPDVFYDPSSLDSCRRLYAKLAFLEWSSES